MLAVFFEIALAVAIFCLAGWVIYRTWCNPPPVKVESKRNQLAQRLNETKSEIENTELEREVIETEKKLKRSRKTINQQ